MEAREIRAALDRHWAASDANDFEAEHQIYREDAVSNIRNRASASAADGRFSRPAPRSRTGSASPCGGSSAQATSGSPNSSSPMTGGRPTP